MGIIYCATNKITHEYYIGYTTKTLEERKEKHFKDAKKGSDSHFHRAIRKYDFDFFYWRILDSAETRKELKRIEMDYICMFGASFEGIGYNLTEGGDGGEIPNEITRKKLSEAGKGRVPWNKEIKYSEEHIKKLIYSHSKEKGIPRSEDTKEKISKSKTGKKREKFSEEWIKNLSKATTGINNPRARKVINLDTQEIFNCIYFASDKYNICPQDISKCCRKKRKTSGGYHWEYYKEVN